MTFKNSTKSDRALGIAPAFTLKLLILCISVALYVLLVVFAGLLLTGADCDFGLLAQNSQLGIWSIIVLGCVGVFIGLSVLYVLVAILSYKGVTIAKYHKFYQSAGLIFLLLLFISLGILLSMVIMTLCPARWSAAILVMISGLLAFAPVLATWWIEDEERLKNFIDAMSKTCSTLTFIGGGCALLLKFLVG